MRHSARCLAIVVTALMLAACNADHLSFLNAQGPVASVQREHFLQMVALLAIFVALPIFVLLPWFAWRYRYGARDARYTPKWVFLWPLEIATWSGPLVIVGLLSVLLWRSTHALDPYKPLASSLPAMRIQVIGYDWKWLFIYPEQGVASIGEMAFPSGQPVTLQLTSATVMQSFQIPSLGSQIYAMGGMVTELNLQAAQPGQFMGENTMYNGDGFHQQHFKAIAMTPAEFQTWVHRARTQGVPMDAVTLHAISQRSTRAQLMSSLGNISSTDGNVYFSGVLASLFPAVVKATSDGSTTSAAHASNQTAKTAVGALSRYTVPWMEKRQ